MRTKESIRKAVLGVRTVVLGLVTATVVAAVIFWGIKRHHIITLTKQQKQTASVPHVGAPRFDAASSHSSEFLHPDHAGMSSPFLLAGAMQPANTDLLQWLQEFESRADAGKVSSIRDRQTLETILVTSNLSALEMLDLGLACSKASNDSQAAAVFYTTAMPLAHNQLTTGHSSRLEVHQLLLAENLAKIKLWSVFEEDAIPRYIDTLSVANNDLMHYVAPDDRRLANAHVHGYIGTIECMMLQGKVDDAIAFAKTINTAEMTDEQLASFAWAYAYALRTKEDDVAAIPQLEIAAADPAFKYCQQANLTLIHVLDKLGRHQEAQDRAKNYTSKFGPLPGFIHLSPVNETQ